MPINVNKPYLPDIKKYHKYLDQIWQNNHLTNFGPLACALEEKLQEFLGVPNLLFVSNGTIALQIAYKLAGLKKDDKIITTPFSFVATTNTLLWEGLNPVFCDIDPKSFCIDTNKILPLLTTETKAILPVHVFGNACDVKALQTIAKKHNLKVIYDGAHAFGVKYEGKSIFEYGDFSTLSFHATKLFHTIEGGLVIAKDEAMIAEAKKMINFGLENSLPSALGINAKNSEFHAAMGLCVLEDLDFITQERQKIWEYYHQHLKDDFALQSLQADNNNHHYFPILFEEESALQKALLKLNEADIFPRRYFYPSLNTLKHHHTNVTCPISEDICSRILCLPIYVGLDQTTQDKIIRILK
ncbi:DegT/DnrJ/EryC1/StrS family aminotransferase [Helicobacter sp. 11S02596-1]|uniref:DegT/DnrJ/EryC1/StrS family aminotransferase n=1 Tax=Helicobacter sp. 11S02596-1 TaxID=1476194 RepID=UPI000BA5E032|nr:DegT/DnrJ/EryC1/StrS family aminotransferase [Helicobacter sp. 11S02596-1]PAF45154.1 aminotransferase DegT [Helicobacter sp. 11S02596-1]